LSAKNLALPLPPMPTLSRPLGRHLATGPGLESAIVDAQRIGCTSVQIFPGNPKGWHYTPLPAERSAKARAGWTAAGVSPLVIHAPYIINPASPEDRLHASSKQGIRNALTHGRDLGATAVVVHLGSHKGTGHDAGSARLIEACAFALEGLPDDLYLLLENNVGAGNSMGGTLDALGGLLRDAAHPQMGVCIDSAHLWGAGYDLTTSDGVEHALAEIDRAVGLAHVRVLHANDSPVPLGSHRDQHAHLGQGQIGYVGLAALLAHPALAGVPAVLETPDGGVEEEIIRIRVAALLCMGDAEGARALQETALPVQKAGPSPQEEL
jgi:deoxyribonuclease IV